MTALPGPLAPTQTLSFPSADGTSLYGEWFAAAKPRAVAIMVHGYAEHCGRYREVAHALVQAGISSFGYDMRGHGQAAGKRGHVRRFSEYLDDLEAATAKARTFAGDLPRVLVAHSNGSLIALRALTDDRRRPDVRAVAVASPFLGLKLKVPAGKVLAGRVASRIYPSLALPNALRVEDLTADAGKQEERRRDTLCHSVATARWFTEATAAQAFVYDRASTISVPTVWLVGGADPIADPARSRAVQARITAPSVFHDLVGLRHEVFNEVDRGRVFGLLTDYLGAQLGA
jgi:alpha-beta hydrolase superfamily lysophospholipase